LVIKLHICADCVCKFSRSNREFESKKEHEEVETRFEAKHSHDIDL
jgi:hypothetical protein